MKRTWIITAAAVIVIAAAIAIGVSADLAGSKGYVKRCDHSLTYFYEDEAGATRFFYDGKLLDGQIAGSVDSFLSCDGTVAIARAGTGLYRIDAEGILLLYPSGVDRAALSLDSSTVVFTTATQLHIYDHSTGKLTDVKPDGVNGVPSVAVSADGGTAAYTLRYPDGSYEACIYSDGRSEKLADNAYVLAVSDGAESVWYLEPDTSSLYYMKNGSRAKKAGENVSGLVEFNRELTEAIFDIAGVTCYSIKGSKAEVLVSGASLSCTKPECSSIQGGEKAAGSVGDCSTLFNCVYYTALTSSDESKTGSVYNLYYINKLRHAKKLAGGSTGFSMTKDRRTLALLVDNVLYSMDSDEPSTAVQLADNVYMFGMAPDGSSLYALGYNLGLYYIVPDVGMTQLDGSTVYFTVTQEGRCLYLADYDSVGELRLADGVNGVTDIMSGVAHVEVKPGVIFCYSGFYENEYGKTVYDVYVSTDGGKAFEPALRGALKLD